MSFPVANLMRAYAFLDDWAAVDRLLDPAAKRPLREFQDGLAFIRTKRHPTPENVVGMRSALEAHYNRTGCVDVSRLVYAAHVGLVEEAYRTAETACLGPRGTEDDMMGPDGYRTGLLFWDGMPEICTVRASCAYARAAGSRQILVGDRQVARLRRPGPL